MCMYKWPPAVFLVSFQLLYSEIVSSAVMLIGSSVFLVGSVVFPASSLIRYRSVFQHRIGCTVVVLVLASAFLHVKISVKVFRVTLEVSLVFGARLCWGGGGNVTFHGNTVPAGNTLSLMSALYLWATLRCGVIGCHGNLV